ncbi:hypothetical protein JCM19301_1582 [Jejuia pallidilutea]|uniref:Uncharacterized protein n=1 Tax=Jejuia pallidilutea TaxID=504487 RepID=A0A090WCT8_9FLAO|nr:hypothetical protein JCM19301_1582 [Jejuia pallidilutea]GAL73259.1 hypothetical protein JCM19302_161 [Jejuia pallidilutea]GAL89999.1 hypothetical protein JCM19538_2830 [Jejuia pallidilutea]
MLLLILILPTLQKCLLIIFSFTVKYENYDDLDVMLTLKKR